jgi:hypothetical protein
MNDVQLSLLVIGLVAISRRWEPKIDGALVALTSVFLACVASVIAGPCEFAVSLVRGVVTGLSAFGAMSAVRYAAKHITPSRTDVFVASVPASPASSTSSDLEG